MGSSRVRQSTRHRARARTDKQPSKPPETSASPPRRLKPAQRTEALYLILDMLVKAISLIRTAKRSIEQREDEWDEVVTLEAAIKVLRLVDSALDAVSDGFLPDEHELGGAL